MLIRTRFSFRGCARAAPRSVRGPHAMTGALKTSVRAPRLLSCSALPIGPAAASEAKGLRRRCDGAVPGRDRWHGSSVFSSPPPSRVLRMGQPYARQATACSAPPTESARTAVARDTGRHADDASRQKFSRERDTHERNAPRRRLAPKVTHTHTQAAATPSSPSTRTEVARSMCGSCGRSSRPWARSRRKRSSFR